MRRYVRQLLSEAEGLIAAAEASIREAEAAAAKRRELRRAEIEAGRAADPGTPEEPYIETVDEQLEDELFFEQMEAVEDDIAGRRNVGGQPLATYCGLDLAALPEPASLSEDEAEALCGAYNHLIACSGFRPLEFTTVAEDIPMRVLYDNVLRYLRNDTARIARGEASDYGCSYWAPECGFGEYCGCLEHWLVEDFVAAGGDPAMPAHRFGDREYLLAERAEEEREDAEEAARIAAGEEPGYDERDIMDLPF